MKKYVKPTLEVIQLRVREEIANTTIYNIDVAAGDPSYSTDTYSDLTAEGTS